MQLRGETVQSRGRPKSRWKSGLMMTRMSKGGRHLKLRELHFSPNLPNLLQKPKLPQTSSSISLIPILIQIEYKQSSQHTSIQSAELLLLLSRSIPLSVACAFCFQCMYTKLGSICVSMLELPHANDGGLLPMLAHSQVVDSS